MQLLYVSTFMFHQEEGVTYALPSCADTFFSKYLDVFDSVRVLGEETKKYLNKSVLTPMESDKITVRILPANTRPQDFKNDRYIRQELTEEIRRAEAVLIKPASRRGMMAIRIAEKLGKPYMIEMTGDIHNALTQSPSRIKRLYAPVLYCQMKKAISKCPFALYVSRDYLQSKYPIPGVMCGCSDVVLDTASEEVLQRRLDKIDGMTDDQIIHMALIGFYQGNGKGVDTALRAMARLPQRYHLSVLGNGTEENRQKWYDYAAERGVSADRLHFPQPLPSAAHVLRWLDDFDFYVFPTRSEGFGRVVAEAMSRGLPCVATDICTMPELLPQDCLFPLDDDAALARLLADFAADKERMKQAARINFEHAKDYDPAILRERRNAFLREFQQYCCEKNGKN